MIPGGIWPVIGQECICPDGVGRISKIIQCKMYMNFPLEGTIQVETYFNNRSCHWDAKNITLIKLNTVKEEEEEE